MRIQALLTAGLMLASAACSSNSPTSPTGSGGAGGGTGTGSGYGGGGGGGGGMGGGTGGNTSGGTPSSGDVAVIVGNIFMKSGHNGSVNPAVDTVAVGGSVTWTWTNTASSRWQAPHSPPEQCSPATAIPTG
jgi:hypothetical protein